MTKNFSRPSLLLLFLDPGTEIRDPGWVKIRIRDKHPGSATLEMRMPQVTGPVCKKSVCHRYCYKNIYHKIFFGWIHVSLE
jgi:hypothetical protein